jgi:pre-mRNA-splicing factor ATP-dependent RNA helicase DHX16
MSAKKELQKWVSEQLYGVVGYSDRNLSEYIVVLAEKAKARGPGSLLASLVENGIPDSPATRSFCQDILARTRASAPSSSSSSSSTHLASTSNTATTNGRVRVGNNTSLASNADLMRESQRYELLDMSSDLDPLASVSSSSSVAALTRNQLKEKDRNRENEKESKKKEKKEKKDKEKEKVKGTLRTKRRRVDGDGDESSEDETQVRSLMAERRQQQEEDDQERERVGEQEGEEAERRRQMDSDIRDRDALVARMREREDLKTKKTAAAAAAAASGGVGSGAKRAPLIEDKSTVDQLREVSRQHYLEKRESKELKLLEMTLKDEEYLFGDVALSAEEQRRVELNRRILAMATAEDRFSYKEEGYRMPVGYEDEGGRVDKQRRDAVLNSRYEEEGRVKSEQEVWEEEQVRLAGLAQGRGRGREGEGQGQDEYELLFEDQIEFVSQALLEGTLKVKGTGIAMSKGRGSDSGSGSDSDKESDQPESMTAHERILAGRKRLPVYAFREEFLSAVKDNRILVVVGETGSGKTTQIPQFLHEAGWSKLGKIGCTQPRRVAAMSVAARVADEMAVKLGQEVGYSIRFEDCTSEKTIIKYMTDGMLLREFLTEPDLKSYSCMIIDEAHERTLSTDVLFGLIKDISRFRGDDFRIVISSATLNAEKFSAYFDDAAIFMIPGHMYDVDIHYTKAPEADYLDAVVVTVLQIHVSQEIPGDILVFLTGQEEIETAAELLALRTKGLGSRIPELMICPIYSSLPSDMQARIFERAPDGGRKVVLATNIAETSLTIDGICYVVDTGFCKQKSFNPKRGMESLVVVPISKAAARQRAGRAGRTQPGKCFRLFTKWSFTHELEDTPMPEIQRSNMNDVVLKLKSLGINDLLNFDFMDKPPPEALMRALEQLYALGGLNDRGELTRRVGLPVRQNQFGRMHMHTVRLPLWRGKSALQTAVPT